MIPAGGLTGQVAGTSIHSMVGAAGSRASNGRVVSRRDNGVRVQRCYGSFCGGNCEVHALVRDLRRRDARGVGAGATAGAQSSSSEKPKATDVGITDKEIHVAVIADVDSPLAPNLFKAAVDGMKGWAKYINSKAGGGGLAGRKVVVDFYDSKLNPAETKNAEITACQNDVAAVGTSAVFLTSVDEMRNCKDSTGAVTGLPDIPFVSTALVQQCSDQSFPIAPPQVLCDTATDHPQTFQANVARGYYYLDKYGKDLHGVYVFGSDSKSARDASFASLGGLRDIGGVDQGIKSDEDFDISSAAHAVGVHAGRADDEEQRLELRSGRRSVHADGVTAQGGGAAGRDRREGLGLRRAVLRQAVHRRRRLPTSRASTSDTLFLPFYSKADQKANPMLANFVKYIGADKLAGFGMYAWAAGIAFRDAVNAQVKAGGVNSVTRKTIFEQLNKIHKFDADGMFAPIDLAGREASGVLCPEPGEERRLRAGRAHEARHVRLPEERADPPQARPVHQQLTKTPQGRRPGVS